MHCILDCDVITTSLKSMFNFTPATNKLRFVLSGTDNFLLSCRLFSINVDFLYLLVCIFNVDMFALLCFHRVLLSTLLL